MAETQRSLYIGGVEEIFDNQPLGMAALDDLQELDVYVVESFRKGNAGTSDDAALDEGMFVPVGVDRSVASSLGARVDTEDSQGTRLGSTSAGSQGSLDLLFLDVEVGPDVCCVFVVFKGFHEPKHLHRALA